VGTNVRREPETASNVIPILHKSAGQSRGDDRTRTHDFLLANPIHPTTTDPHGSKSLIKGIATTHPDTLGRTRMCHKCAIERGRPNSRTSQTVAEASPGSLRSSLAKLARVVA